MTMIRYSVNPATGVGPVTHVNPATGVRDSDSPLSPGVGCAVTPPSVMSTGGGWGHTFDDPAHWGRDLLPLVGVPPDLADQRGRHTGAGGWRWSCVGSRAPAPAAGVIEWPPDDKDTSPAVAGMTVPPDDHGTGADAAVVGSTPSGADHRRPALADSTPTRPLRPLRSAPSAGEPGRLTTADVASWYPALAALSDAWMWRVWHLPGSAADTTLVGELIRGGVLTTVFIQTEDAASVWWMTVADQRTLGTVHGRLSEVVTQVTRGRS